MSSKQEPRGYLRAATFPDEESAGQVYFHLQELIAHVAGDVDLSVYRFSLSDVVHVAVVGESPPGELRQEIEAAIAGGESVRLDRPTRRWLRQRRAEQLKRGPWVEHHFRPGRGVRFGR